MGEWFLFLVSSEEVAVRSARRLGNHGVSKRLDHGEVLPSRWIDMTSITIRRLSKGYLPAAF